MNFYRPVLKLTAEYEKHTDWLFKLAWEYIPIIKITGREGKKQAAYRAVSDAIELAPDDNVAVLFGSYIHELYHAYQRRKLTLPVYLLALGLARPLLEKRAKEEELKAVEWAGEYQMNQWRKDAEERLGKASRV